MIHREATHEAHRVSTNSGKRMLATTDHLRTRPSELRYASIDALVQPNTLTLTETRTYRTNSSFPESSLAGELSPAALEATLQLSSTRPEITLGSTCVGAGTLTSASASIAGSLGDDCGILRINDTIDSLAELETLTLSGTHTLSLNSNVLGTPNNDELSTESLGALLRRSVTVPENDFLLVANSASSLKNPEILVCPGGTLAGNGLGLPSKCQQDSPFADAAAKGLLQAVEH